MTHGFRSAFDETDHASGQMKGLIHALDALARDYNGVNNPDPAANAIMVLINMLAEKIGSVAASHQKE